ncbi:hypothetical protein [Aquimarina algiphila]|uniref:hypothetical protein n=1 Tax=Aquimarina algiphila TaxID=2047982 RepID=UPI00232F0126|nr:hypothetical protein [Aquimarina algiphila]
MSYQAIIRDASDNLVTSQPIGMQISILQGSASGTAVFVETQTPTTNYNGLVSIEIGAGTIVNGDFTTIDWANGPYFIKTETDPAGGISYSITGTSQLLSVPYALYAKTAKTITGTITETDPVFDSSISRGITKTDITNWNNKQDKLTAGTGIDIMNNVISGNTQKKYRLEYVSGDGQTYGGGMPFAMVFKIFNITDSIYVTSLMQDGLTIVSTGNIGYEDANFNNLNDYCGNGSNECYGGYYYIPSTNLPSKPFNLIVTITLRYSITGEVIERYIINQYIQ